MKLINKSEKIALRIGVIISSHYLKGEEDEKGLIQSLHDLNIPYQIIDWKRHSITKYKWLEKPVDLITAIGTISFIKYFWENFESDIPVHTFFSPTLHKYSNYKVEIPDKYFLNQKGILLPFGEIRNRNYNSLLNYVKSDNPEQQNKNIFFRPDNALKICEAELVTYDNFLPWIMRSQNNTGLTDTSLMWLFGEKKIENEYRCLVYNNQCVSVSQYMDNSQVKIELINDSLIKKHCDYFAQNIFIDESFYIMDIALCNGEYKIVELNAFATSGQYLLNKYDVYRALISACEDVYKELYDF